MCARSIRSITNGSYESSSNAGGGVSSRRTRISHARQMAISPPSPWKTSSVSLPSGRAMRPSMRWRKNARRSSISSATTSRDARVSRFTAPQPGQRVVECPAMKIESAKALVTGGSSGIGLETARRLISRGGRVAICGRDRTKLERAAREIGALAIPTDVSIEKDVVTMVRRLIDEFGDYNVLINNAGFGSFATLLETSLAEMQRVYATNVFGAMLVARESA